MRALRPAVALAASASALAIHGAVAAEGKIDAPEVSAADQCVMKVIGADRDGRLLTSAPVCYPTLAEALAEAGVRVDRGDADLTFAEVERSGVLREAVQSSGMLGTHWDGANRSGASITVTGGECAGGYHNLSAAWSNRISSTWNGCPAVLFYDGYDKTGSHENTSAGSINLGSMNNAANSIAYAP